MNAACLRTWYIFFILILPYFLHSQCISGDCKDGNGVMLLSDGARYEGAFKNGEIHGFGTCEYADGSVYRGSWSHRLPDGMGRKTYPDGKTYEGLWDKGLPVSDGGDLIQGAALQEASSLAAVQTGCLDGDCKNGIGVYAYPDGSKCEGTFKNGMLHGPGRWYYRNGLVLDGRFQEGLPHGNGELLIDGGKYQLAGTWVDGEFMIRNQNKIKLGCIEGDCQFGKGVYVFNKGTALYVGQFSNSVPDGRGTCYYVTGNIYQGYWFKGAFHGKGTLSIANGTDFEGQWRFGNYQDNILALAAKSGTRPDGGTQPNNEDDEFQYLAMEPPVTWQDFPASLPQNNERLTDAFSEPDPVPNDLIPSTERVDDVELLSYQAESQTRQQRHNSHQTPETYSQSQQTVEPPPSEPLQQEPIQQAIVKHRPIEQPRVWAVVVGVSSYHHMPALRYTDDDAYRIFAFLKSPEGGGLSDDQIRVLIDEDATKRNIVSAMMDVFYQAGPRDLVMLYFSGHGLKGSFLPFDYDGYNNKLYHHEVNDILKNSPANFKLCIADACHSGSLMSVKGGDLPSVLSSYYNHLAQMEPGSALFMSSKSEELSLESSGLRQGVFTHYLIRGLKGEADEDQNHAVSLEELYKFVTAGVQQYTRYRQTPLIKGKFDRSTIVSVIR